MERLTERTADGILVKENYEKETLKTLYSCYGEKPNSYYSNCEEGYCAMEKLADYEDAEEQGRRDSRHTNADRIRNMSDEELAEWLTNMCDIERHEEPYKSIYNLDTEQEEEIHDSYGDLLKWLQSEAE